VLGEGGGVASVGDGRCDGTTASTAVALMPEPKADAPPRPLAAARAVSGQRASSREAAGAGAPQGCKPCDAAGVAIVGDGRRGEHLVEDGVLG
jgi:hypothetical protein